MKTDDSLGPIYHAICNVSAKIKQRQSLKLCFKTIITFV